MSKHIKFFSFPEFCKSNSLQPIEFYEILSRRPGTAKKLNSNAKGECLLDERSITAAGAILCKIEKATHSKIPMSWLLGAKSSRLQTSQVRFIRRTSRICRIFCLIFNRHTFCKN